MLKKMLENGIPSTFQSLEDFARLTILQSLGQKIDIVIEYIMAVMISGFLVPQQFL
jgi:hypothetical protein